MISESVKSTFNKLAIEVAPFLNISDEAHCDPALELLEYFCSGLVNLASN